MVSDAEIRAWAQGVGFTPELGYCVGKTFALDHDGRLPESLEEMCSWATATGRRGADGTWNCTLPAGTTGPTAAESLSDWVDTQIAKVRAWSMAHPTEAAGAIVFAVLVAMGSMTGRRR